MAELLLSDESRVEGARRLARLVDLFGEEIKGTPGLGEFLEILSVSVPGGNEFFGRIPVPLHLKAKVRGNRRYVGNQESRITKLNDAVFVEASDFLLFLGERVFAAGHRDLTGSDLAFGILQTLKESGVLFEDVSAADVVSLEAVIPKGIVRVKRGDIVAIPGGCSKYHVAVVVARNRFGTALGLLRGDFVFPRVESIERCQARFRPVYVDEKLIANGMWPVVDHLEDLLSLFPDEPEIYHAPDLLWPGGQTGEFGSAESPSGGLRRIGKEEAEEIGLLSGAYRQVYVSGHLQQLLDDEIDRRP